ncbi:DUF5123 domain-containing protein [Arachidicoccus soli]|uniref:DUF5123 domain-containing protein n=1 Tax=Arachidicoccus soli TaxID=2341117 RepID=A0A386HNR1_9BACT|nr:DUF5123 domain-containing protein [Arachidicoccus soli]AYD47302.1 DUF5123 domain-containing protein [Arachidicoccus soli]
MKKAFLKLIAFGLIVSSAASCIKKVNDWPVDPSHARLFTPLTFALSKANATSVELSYTQSISTTKYVFEFSKDSLQFKNIVKTVEILADTLTPFAPSTTPTQVLYHTTFDNLDGTTGYSVRMKCVDTTTGLESNYSELYFQTLAEQLFTGSEIGIDHIKVNWTPTDSVTNITVYSDSTSDQLQQITLTNADKQAGSLDITGLSAGTNYKIIIYKNAVVRGTLVVKTTGLKGAVIIPVNPEDSIPALIANAIAQGTTNITLLFKGGQTYNLGTLILPKGLSNISFTGENSVDGKDGLPATVNISEARLTDAIFGKMIFENLILVGGTSNYLINIATDNVQVDEYNFVNCIISNYRSVTRVQNKLVKLGQININNSILHNIGGYGIVNIGGPSITLDSIKLVNNTIINSSTQIMDVRTTVKTIAVNNNTIYNQSVALNQFILFDQAAHEPITFQGANNIIAGTNNGAQMKAFSLTYAGSFASSYRTNEMTMSQDFPSITIFNGPATAIFADPENGDFTLKSGSGFGGIGTAGDPRWWQ